MFSNEKGERGVGGNRQTPERLEKLWMRAFCFYLMSSRLPSVLPTHISERCHQPTRKMQTWQRWWFLERNTQITWYNPIVVLLTVVGVAVFAFGVIWSYLCFMVVMSERGWGEWMHPDKWLHSDWFSNGSWFLSARRESAWQCETGRGPSLSLHLSFSLISISPLLSLFSTFIPLSPQAQNCPSVSYFL